MKKVIIYLILLAFAVYIGFQFATVMSNTVETQEVLSYTAVDAMRADGVLIRSESTIQSDLAGTAYFYVGNGEKVGKNTALGAVYPSAKDAVLLARADELGREIARYEKAQMPMGLFVSDLVEIELEIDTLLKTAADCASRDDFDGYADLQSEVAMLANRRAFVMGEVSGFEKEIEALEKQRQETLSSVGTKLSDLVTPKSGYFYNSCDGFEYLTPDDITYMLPSQLKEIGSPKETGENTGHDVCKIADSFKWYIAINLPEADAQRLEMGRSYELTFPYMHIGSVTAKVVRISHEQDGAVAVAFESIDVLQELGAERFATVDIVLKKYEGLKVPDGSIRTIDGQMGVYVLVGLQAKFKPIEVLYSGDGFKVARYDDRSTDNLLLYDELIVKGKNLYDGKIVK